jgi:tripartite ATP-independent transporter DctM subunit
LLAPVLILGGMRSGMFTPTEAAVVAVFYGLFVGLVVYRTLNWDSIYEVLAEAAEVSGVILLIIALASVFAWAGSTLGAFETLGSLLIGISSNETIVLLAVTVLLMIAGMFLDAVSILFIFVPFLLPVIIHFKWDPVWFGIILAMNMAIGQFTPPMAINLMVTCRIAGIRIEDTVSWVLWLVGAMVIALLLVTFIPDLALAFPRMLGYLS